MQGWAGSVLGGPPRVLPSYRYKAKSAKEKGTWGEVQGTASPNFQESSFSGVKRGRRT